MQLVLATETRSDGTVVEVAPEQATLLEVDLGTSFVAVTTAEPPGAVVRLLDEATLTPRLVIELAGARRASAPLRGGDGDHR